MSEILNFEQAQSEALCMEHVFGIYSGSQLSDYEDASFEIDGIRAILAETDDSEIINGYQNVLTKLETIDDETDDPDEDLVYAHLELLNLDSVVVALPFLDPNRAANFYSESLADQDISVDTKMNLIFHLKFLTLMTGEQSLNAWRTSFNDEDLSELANNELKAAIEVGIVDRLDESVKRRIRIMSGWRELSVDWYKRNYKDLND